MKPEDKGNAIVGIVVDDEPVEIHRGRQSIEDIKKAGNVQLAYDLNLVVDGKFDLLADDGTLTIKGGEIFISHPKDGSSS